MNDRQRTEGQGAALVLIDVINDLEFDGGDKLLDAALPVVERIADLKRRAREAGMAVIYANDNFGRWRSDFHSLVEHCLKDPVRGRLLAEKLAPGEDDYFILKPKHSAFLATPLQILLETLGTHTLILTGITGDMCVLFTAIDAYMREYRLYIPSDCVISIDRESNGWALEYARRVLKSDNRASSDVVMAEVFRTGEFPEHRSDV